MPVKSEFRLSHVRSRYRVPSLEHVEYGVHSPHVQLRLTVNKVYAPHHEKTRFYALAKKGADQLRSNAKDSHILSSKITVYMLM